MENETNGVNIAPSSTAGHYVQGARQVVDLDKVTESFFVEGKSKLVTEKHKTMNMNDDVFINCQVVYNAFEKMYEKSLD